MREFASLLEVQQRYRLLDEAELCERLGWSSAVLVRKLAAHRIFSLQRNDVAAYPAYFADPRRYRRQLEAVCQRLNDLPAQRSEHEASAGPIRSKSEEQVAGLQHGGPRLDATTRCRTLREGQIGLTQTSIWLRWRSREKISNRQIDQQPISARVAVCGWRCGHASNWPGAASSRRLTAQFSTTHGSSRPLTVVLEVI